MTFKFKAAEPINNRLLIALAGPQASGKTTSALRLATGITQVTGGKVGLIDTENRRALRYAKDFAFNHMEFAPPFNPKRYQEAIEAAMKDGYGDGDVLIIDSMSHEHDGPGGVLEMHDMMLDKLAGDDYKKRDKLTFTAWIKPKGERNRAVQMGLGQCRAHILLCFRAKEKTSMVKNEETGKIEVLKEGWQPIGGDEYFYEMDITMILPQGSFGKPDWKEKAGRINEYGDGPLKNLLYNTQQISETTGNKLAEWAKGFANKPPADPNDPRTIATNIGLMIKKAQDAGTLALGWQEFEDDGDIEKVKQASTIAYDDLIKRRDEKLKTFG